MSFHFTQRKPVKEHIRYIPNAVAKVVDGLMSEWKDIQVREKVDVENKVPPKRKRVPVRRIEIPYIFCMGQKFIKVMYEKKLSNIKKI